MQCLLVEAVGFAAAVELDQHCPKGGILQGPGSALQNGSLESLDIDFDHSRHTPCQNLVQRHDLHSGLRSGIVLLASKHAIDRVLIGHHFNLCRLCAYGDIQRRDPPGKTVKVNVVQQMLESLRHRFETHRLCAGGTAGQHCV